MPIPTKQIKVQRVFNVCFNAKNVRNPQRTLEMKRWVALLIAIWIISFSAFFPVGADEFDRQNRRYCLYRHLLSHFAHKSHFRSRLARMGLYRLFSYMQSTNFLQYPLISGQQTHLPFNSPYFVCKRLIGIIDVVAQNFIYIYKQSQSAPARTRKRATTTNAAERKKIQLKFE
ncbi:Hypothetical_protein [Hexamita inflata]|uniref:Hypothetical_protein n=1 Tax=Hexamita inflata TaxID=28002 RepID=A0AA86QSK0_9EUKA|nr:Hypothetical protein HINF_LOCUS46119 [Hexamita inflata]